MSTREDGPQSPIVETKAELIGYIAAGEKPKTAWRIGTEHEKFPFYTEALTPVPYEGPRGIRALLEGLATQYGWQPILEGETIIGLKQPDCPLGGTISLEPGGQFELSGAPLETIHQTCDETGRHLAQVRDIGGRLGIGFLGMGFSPLWRLDDTPRMPKRRYQIMSGYMPRVGARGLDMMHRTCTVQVNLDFSSEADMVQKLRVGLALQPIATALFAASPFTEGAPNGFKSLRSQIWAETDPGRTGMLPWAFEAGMGYERYVDYALDVPMYFVYRNGHYVDCAGQSFRAFLGGELTAMPGEKPTLADWSDHLTTLFPEVRLKRFLEMRGADGGPWRNICALPAFWVGLLYDQAALDAAWDLVKGWTAEERQALRDGVPRAGLATPHRGETLRDVASRVLAIAREGLKARARAGSLSVDETGHIAVLERMAASGQTMADQMLTDFHGRWGGDVRSVFAAYAY